MNEEVTDHEYRLSAIILCLMQRLGIEDVIISPLDEVDDNLTILLVSVEDEKNNSLRVQRLAKEDMDDAIDALNNKRQSKMQ